MLKTKICQRNWENSMFHTILLRRRSRQFYTILYLLVIKRKKYINNLFFCRVYQDFKYLPDTKKISLNENNSFTTSTN